MEQATLFFDLSKINKKIKEDEYQNKFRNLFVCKNLYDSLDDDEQEDIEKTNEFYIDPNDISCYIIDSLNLIASIISLIYIPIFLAYALNNCKLNLFSKIFIINILIDIIYLIDLITGFFRAYYNFEEVLIIKKKYIFFNYIKGNFLIDLIEAIPYFIILNLGQEECNNSVYNNFSFSNNLKYTLLLLKIFKIFKINDNSALKKIDNFFNKSNFFSDWKALLTNIFLILSALHLASCYFIFLGNNLYPNWIFRYGLHSVSFKDIYIAAIYYVMTTLTTVGYGDISVTSHYERIFQIVLLIVGTCAYSWILTYISNYIKKNNEKYIVFEEKLKILDEIKVNYPNLNPNLYERITRYLNYNKSKYKHNVKYVLDSLPLSIQNNLIIEIYKPIIKNFRFFKYLENSDFFVKIVTSMKPILAKKEDILVNEGDIIEDIIFIKKGVLSLKVGINIDEPKQFIEEYLNMTRRNTKSNNYNTLSQFQTITPVKNDNILFSFITKSTKKFENKIFNKKYLKIIDLRKNEHFGDALMILNEKSPVTIQVKSKKAELLFLQKTDATEISNIYPNIWKRVVNKSLFNMKQIKNLIKRKIILFCEFNAIQINPELKNKYSDDNQIDNDKIFNKVKFDFQEPNKGKRIIKSVITEEDESKLNSKKNSSISKRSYKDKKGNSNEDIKGINEPNQKLSLIKDEDKNNTSIEDINKKTLILNKDKQMIDDNIINDNKNNLLKLNILSHNKWKSDKINKIKNSNTIIKFNSFHSLESINCNLEGKNFERVNEEQYFNEDIDINIINKQISMNNFDKNNFIFHQEKKSFENERNEENSISPNNNNCHKINKLIVSDITSDINIEKLLIDNKSINTDNGNKKINIYNNIFISNSNKNNNILNENYNKNNKILYLENLSADSFTINAIYENINEISNYRYSTNPSLKQKVKKIIMQKQYSSYKTIQLSQYIKKNEVMKNMTLKNENLNNKSKSRKLISHSAGKKKYEKNEINKNTYVINYQFKKIDSTIEKKDVTSFHQKENKRNRSQVDIINLNDEEKTFYTRIQNFKEGKKQNKHKEKNKEKESYNYEEQILKNIEKNKQNLNNPEEYFSGFFSNILSKKNIK